MGARANTIATHSAAAPVPIEITLRIEFIRYLLNWPRDRTFTLTNVRNWFSSRQLRTDVLLGHVHLRVGHHQSGGRVGDPRAIVPVLNDRRRVHEGPADVLHLPHHPHRLPPLSPPAGAPL